jgi:hypothetical protein
MRRNGFHRQGSADAPFPAHRHAIQRAQNDQHRQRGRESGRKLENRIKQDIDHQGRAAAPFVGGATENECANRAHRQGQQNGECDVRYVGVELGRDILQHEYQKKEIERVERPSEKACRHDMLLLAGPTRESRDSHDRSNHRTGIVA